jgi:hypothetical protein
MVWKTENGKRFEDPVGWTILEQSMLLVSCGLDAKSADMYYEQKFDDYGTPLYEWRLVAEKSRAIEENLFSWRQKYVEPCWSLGKLISIISSCNKKFENLHFFEDTDSNKVVLYFFCKLPNAPEFSGATELEACVNAVCWLLENRYIEKEK